MPSKTFSYNVAIKASLETSKLAGAGSRVSRQVQDEISKPIEAQTRGYRNLQKEIASLERQSLTLGRAFNRLGDVQSLSKVRSIFEEIQRINRQGLSGKGGLLAEIQNQFRSLNSQKIASEFASIGKASSRSFGSSFQAGLAGFFGGIGGGLVASLVPSFQQVFSFVNSQIDEMTRIASERQNAFRGLSSLASAFNIDDAEAEETVRGLRLVRAGILDIGDAATSTKNLLSSGFSLEESRRILEAFSDTAAFGKSAALDFGEAIRSATEGVRNGNSILVDNVGLTKNLSAILKDAGFAEKDLSRVKEDANVRQALYNGLLKEAIPQLGDADRLTQTWTGSTSALTAAKNNLYAVTGDIIINNRELLALIQTLTSETNNFAGEMDRTGSTWNQTVDSMTTKFAEFGKDTRITIRKEIADLAELIQAIETAALGFNALATDFGTGWTETGAERLKRYQEAKSKMGTYYQGALNFEKSFNEEYEKNIRKNERYSPENIRERNNRLLKSVEGMTLADIIGGRQPNSSGTGGNGRVRASTNTDDRRWQDIREFASEEGFRVTSGFRTSGTTGAHKAGIAADISVKDDRGRMLSDEKIGQFVAAAIQKGFRVVDERTKIAGSPYWTGPHLHLEANNRRESTLNPSLSYGPIPLGMLREMDSRRFSKNSVTASEIEQFNSEKIESRIRAREDQDLFNKWDDGLDLTDSDLQQMYGSYSKDKVRRGEMPDRFGEWVAKFGMDRTLGNPDRFSLGYQPGEDLLGKADSLDKLRNLNLKRYEDSTFDEERTIALEQYNEQLKATVRDLDVEYNTIVNINREAEQQIELQSQLNEQTRALGRVETEIAVLRQQNANAGLVSDRQRLSAMQEELALRRDITQLGDDAANGGINDSLKIQVALLQQAADYRQESLQAIIDAKTAEMDINRMLEVRTDVIYGKVMRHLGDQKNLTDAIADGITDMYEGIAGPLDAAIDRTTNKLGPAGSLVGGILKTTGRSFLTNITKGAMDALGLGGVMDAQERERNPMLAETKDQTKLLRQIAINTGGGPGLASIPGGNIFSGSSVRGIFGGGGIGPGGTPYFNPGASGGGGIGGFFGNILGAFGIGKSSSGDAWGGKDWAGIGAPPPLPSAGTSGLLGGLKDLFNSGSLAGIAALAGGPAGLIAALAPLYISGLTTTSKAKGFAIAGALGFFTSIFNLNNLRKKEEKTRSQFRDDAKTQFDNLISAVRGRRMSGDDALAQAEAIRQNYIQEANTLKDKKTRTIALNELNRPNILWQKMEELKSIAEISRFDDARDKRILPEFADGGHIRARRGGILARLGEGGYDEVVLSADPSKAGRTAQLLSGFLANYAPATQSYVSGATPTSPINLTVNISPEIDANGMIKMGIQTDGVANELVKVVNNAIKNNDLVIKQKNVRNN